MSKVRPGKLLVLSAPSGAGKTSLAHGLIERVPGTAFSISHTTRAPRPGERHGVDYFFVNERDFGELVAAGRFLEHARVFDNHYGTSRAVVENLMQQGKNVLLDIDWQGAASIKAQMPEAITVFILPPSREELERRLRGRGQDDDEVIARRMRDAESEMSHYGEFDHVIVNDDFAAALADLSAIVEGRAGDCRPLSIDPAALLAGQVEKDPSAQ